MDNFQTQCVVTFNVNVIIALKRKKYIIVLINTCRSKIETVRKLRNFVFLSSTFLYRIHFKANDELYSHICLRG